MTATDATLHFLLKALLYASIVLSAVMLGESGVDTYALRDGTPTVCLDLTNGPGYWDCTTARRVIPDVFGQAGTAALSGR